MSLCARAPAGLAPYALGAAVMCVCVCVCVSVCVVVVVVVVVVLGGLGNKGILSSSVLLCCVLLLLLWAESTQSICSPARCCSSFTSFHPKRRAS